jgi:protein SCO1
MQLTRLRGHLIGAMALAIIAIAGASFNAGPEWQYYTGTHEASETAQRAFDVYRSAKMDHSPATLVRPAPGAPWVRIDGFATADQRYAELPNLALSAAR